MIINKTINKTKVNKITMIKAGFDRRIKDRGTINKEVINKDNINKDNIKVDKEDNIKEDNIKVDKVINKDKTGDVVEEEKEEDHAHPVKVASHPVKVASHPVKVVSEMEDVKVVSEKKEEKEEEKEEDNAHPVKVASEKEEAVVVEDVVVEMVVSIALKIIKIVSLIKEGRTSLANKSNVVENTIENLGNLLKTFLTVMSQISQKWNKNLKIGISNLLHLPILERRGLVLKLKMLKLLKFIGTR